jgi:hypothetical protein
MTLAYGTSSLNGRRYRRTNAELAEIDTAIYEIAEAEQPVSTRGVYYRVMSRGLVPKHEQQGYGVVQRQTVKLRRSGDLPYAWIADGTRLHLKPRTWSSAEAALEHTAKFYRQALWDDQNVHVEIWSEKDAIRSVVYPVTSDFDVPLMVARGYASESFLWSTAEAIIADGKPAVIYQLGDHDPSGVDAWRVIRERLRGFIPAHIDIEFERIAVTPEQITELSLPTRPTKQSDTRAKKFEGESVEVDAIPSTILRGLVREAIEQWIDPYQRYLTEMAEESEREVLTRIADGWEDVS